MHILLARGRNGSVVCDVPFRYAQIALRTGSFLADSGVRRHPLSSVQPPKSKTKAPPTVGWVQMDTSLIINQVLSIKSQTNAIRLSISICPLPNRKPSLGVGFG